MGPELGTSTKLTESVVAMPTRAEGADKAEIKAVSTPFVLELSAAPFPATAPVASALFSATDLVVRKPRATRTVRSGRPAMLTSTRLKFVDFCSALGRHASR